MWSLLILLLIFALLTFLIWLIGWAFDKKVSFGLLFFLFFALIIALPFVILATREYSFPMKVTQEDIYGTYVIDKSKFSGEQADWQYENFRFEIARNNKLIFEHRVYDDVWEYEKVDISFEPTWQNRRIIIHSDSTSHHIIRDNPTLYRLPYNEFYYVFESEKFGNVFFKKGEWKRGFWDIF